MGQTDFLICNHGMSVQKRVLFIFDGKSTWIICVSFDVWNSPLGSQFQAYALLAISSTSTSLQFQTYATMMCITMYYLLNF